MSEGVVIPWFDRSSFDRAKGVLGGEGDVLAEVASLEDYRLVVEQQLRTVAAVRLYGVRARGVTTIDMDGVDDPAAFEARFDAQVAAGDVTEWPPGRNDRCWCGSNDKYKRCCAALAVDEQLIAERAAMLRDTMSELGTEDSGPPPTLAELLEECDQLLPEVQGASGDGLAVIIQELRHEFFGDAYFPVLAEIARSSEAQTAEDADIDLAPILEHELLRSCALLADHVRFIYADALSAVDRHAAALDTSSVAVERLLALGERLSGYERAIAFIPVIDIDGPEAAAAAFEELLEELPSAEHAGVCDVAADTFYNVEAFVPAATWGVRALRLHLEHPEPEAGRVQNAVGILEAIYEESGLERDQPLLDAAAAWLD